jgi:hypothetical protein
MSDGGKGSKPRPFSISHDEWSTRWDAIFGRDTERNDEGEVRVNKQGQLEQMVEGQWVPSQEQPK